MPISLKMRLFSGTSNIPLSTSIVDNIGMPMGNMNIQRFADGEIYLQYMESIRGLDIFFVQSTCKPTNSNLMEVLIAMDAAKRASARHICAVIPYFGYARQDRKSASRTPISAKLVADLLQAAGATRVLTMDLHATQIQGFFDIPVDNIFATSLFVADIRTVNEHNPQELMVVSPDVGGVVRSRALAKPLGVDIAIVDKRRPAPNVAKVMNIVGDVRGRHCIMVDDIVDTAGTLCNAAQALMDHGASKVSAYVTHGVLSGPAVENISKSALSELVITDSIKQPEPVMACEKIRQLSIAPMLADAISRISNDRSISSLYTI
ncbi:MAG: ribose-phosphate pyrophosphokinase [Mariprofundaceae bacterium]|nr:ribose-phosphate pyrophosphokinase [Mariprofundaceae bacterium]